MLLFQLEEKSSEIALLEKQVEDLQRVAEVGSCGRSLLVEGLGSCERDQLQVRTLSKGTHNYEGVLNSLKDEKQFD